MTKRKFLIFLIIITIFFSSVAFAQEREKGRLLEIEYPKIEGEAPERTITPVPEYVRYIFNFLIWISGLIALGVLIYAGFQYFTSAGSPEKMGDAKDRIGAAILGLAILFGSYLILISINPELISFRLERLRPIISELPHGVLVCKAPALVEKAWNLTWEFRFSSPTKERERQIKKTLDIIFEHIDSECYTIGSAGDIRGDLDNKIQFIYFIPDIKIDEKGQPQSESTTEYGAIIYEDRDFKGKSDPIYEHLLPGGAIKVYIEVPVLKVSSIKPFQLITKPDPNWYVTLYEDYDENKKVWGAGAGGPREEGPLDCGDLWYCDFFLIWSPKSMKVEGDLLAILFTGDNRSETFSSGTYNNLEAYENIVNWVDCEDYQGRITKICETKPGLRLPGTWAPPTPPKKYKCCAEPAAIDLIIIGGSIY